MPAWVAHHLPAWGAQRTLRRLDLIYSTTLAVAMTVHTLRVAPGLCQTRISAGSTAALTLHTTEAAVSSSYEAYCSSSSSSCYNQGLLHRAGCGCLLLPQLLEHLCGTCRGPTSGWLTPSKLACALLVALNSLIKVMVMPWAQPWLLRNPPLGLAPLVVLLHILVITLPVPVLRRRPRSSQHTAGEQGRSPNSSAPQQQQGDDQGPLIPPGSSTAAATSPPAAATAGTPGQEGGWDLCSNPISRAMREAFEWRVTWRNSDWYWKTPRVRMTAALLMRLIISSVRGLSVGPFRPPEHLLPYHPATLWPHMHFLWAMWQACCILLPLRLQFLTTTWEWLVAVYIWHHVGGPLFQPGARLTQYCILAISCVLVVGTPCAATWWFERSWARIARTAAGSRSSGRSRRGGAGQLLEAAAGQGLAGRSSMDSSRSSMDDSDQKQWAGMKAFGKHTADSPTTDSSNVLGGRMQGGGGSSHGACHASSSGSSSLQGSRRSSMCSPSASRRTSLSRFSTSSIAGCTPGTPLGDGTGPLPSCGWPNSNHVMPVGLQEQLLALFGQEGALSIIQQVQPEPAVSGTYTAATETLPVSIKVRTGHSQVEQLGPQLQACLQRCAEREEQRLELTSAAAEATGAPGTAGSSPGMSQRVVARSVCFAGCVQLLGSLYYTAGAAERRQRAVVSAQRVTRVLCDLLSSGDTLGLWESPSKQQQEEAEEQQKGGKGGAAQGWAPRVEVVVDGIASWLDASRCPMSTNHPPQPKPWAPAAQLLYLEPPVLLAADGDGAEGDTEVPLLDQQQQHLLLQQQQQQQLVLVLDLPHQQDGLEAPAAAVAGPGAAPGVPRSSRADTVVCRLLVFTEQRVVVDQVVVLQQRIRVMVPPLPTGYYYVALLPNEEGPAQTPAHHQQCADNATSSTAATTSSSSGRVGRFPSMSAAPLVLQQLVALPRAAACEVQHLWEAAARAVGASDVAGPPLMVPPEGFSPWAAAQLQQAAEVRRMQHKVVVWDSVVLGLLQDMAALLAVTAPTAPHPTTTTHPCPPSSSSQQAGGCCEQHWQQVAAQQQQQQQREEEEGEVRPAGNPGRRSMSSERVAEAVHLQGMVMPLLRFLSQHHMWHAAQWLCGHVGAHIAAATHSSAAAGGSIARTSFTSSAGSGGGGGGGGGGGARFRGASHSLQTFGAGTESHPGGGSGGDPPATAAAEEEDEEGPPSSNPGVSDAACSLGPSTPTSRQSRSTLTQRSFKAPSGSLTATAAVAAAGITAHAAAPQCKGPLYGSMTPGWGSLLECCSSRHCEGNLPPSPVSGKPSSEALRQQEQQQEQQHHLAAAAAREVVVAQARQGGCGWRHTCCQLLRGFRSPFLEEAYLLAISRSCYWADSLAICLPLLPLATSGVTSGLLRRVAGMGLTAGLEGHGGELVAFTAFGLVPLLLLALVGPGVALGRRHELMHGVCEVMMASFAACQMLGWVVVQPEWVTLLGLGLAPSFIMGTMLVIRPLLRQVRFHVQLPWMVLEGVMLLLLAHQHLGTCVLPWLVLRSGVTLAIAVGLLGVVEARRRAAFPHTLCQAAQ